MLTTFSGTLAVCFERTFSILNNIIYLFILIFFREKVFLILTFLEDFYFNYYILFLSFLAFILKNTPRFDLCHYTRNGEN